MTHKQHQQGCPCHTLSRRDFLAIGVATGAGLLLPNAANAADNIRDMQGNVFVNQKLANLATPIKPGDRVTVAQGGRLSFVIGDDAYMLRGGSSLVIEVSDNILVKGVRLLTGGLLAVFGKGEKTIRTGKVGIGIRGTGIYLETSPEKTYFCTCYGETELRVEGMENRIIRSEHHHPLMIHTPESGKNIINTMGMAYHEDDELRAAEALVGRKVPFDA